jgi:hypothetical protein
MNSYINYLNLQPGDRVIVPKSAANIVMHHGIYAGYDQSGHQWFLENHYSSGVRYVSAENFFQNVPLNKLQVQYFSGNEQQRQHAMKFAKSLLGRPYDLFSYNCEHYSNDVQFRTPKSRQVKAGLTIVGILALLVGVFANAKS